jgi:hypothetical protein
MRQSIFETAWYQTIEQRICDVLNAEKGYLSGSTARSTRAVGDAIRDILGHRFRSLIGDDVCKNYSKDFARRAMADLDAAHVRYSHRRILSTGTGQDRQED